MICWPPDSPLVRVQIDSPQSTRIRLSGVYPGPRSTGAALPRVIVRGRR